MNEEATDLPRPTVADGSEISKTAPLPGVGEDKVGSVESESGHASK